jgi:hypothetical protein
MEQDILVGKASCLKCPVKRIVGDLTAVHRQIDPLSAAVLGEGNIVSHPAFHPAALIVVAAGAFFGKLAANLETVNIEIPQISADPAEIFDKFAVCQR